MNGNWKFQQELLSKVIISAGTFFQNNVFKRNFFPKKTFQQELFSKEKMSTGIFFPKKKCHQEFFSKEKISAQMFSKTKINSTFPKGFFGIFNSAPLIVLIYA